MLVLAIPTRNQFDFVFKRLIPSVLSGTRVPERIILWDNSDGHALPDYAASEGQTALKALAPLLGTLPEIAVNIVGVGGNVPLASVWNTVLYNCADTDTIVLANDDLEFFPDTLEKLAASTAPFAYPAGAQSSNSFSLFKIDRALWHAVGPFDGNFAPAYFEDNDYHYRMRLLGFDITPVLDAQYTHVGSATLNAFSPEEQAMFHRYFRRNQALYIFKWGGMPGAETYSVPFNGQDAEQAVKDFNAGYIWH